MTGDEDMDKAIEYFISLFSGDFFKSLRYSLIMIEVAQQGLAYEVIYLAYEKHKATDSTNVELAFDILNEQLGEWLK